mmetsp:Transcript_26575/g.73338  ORF Transcript_26575/g.73338 Transcript_26575/m.73338 type:complete len:359 (+) Transcript_26575:338-1414(+)
MYRQQSKYRMAQGSHGGRPLSSSNAAGCSPPTINGQAQNHQIQKVQRPGQLQSQPLQYFQRVVHKASPRPLLRHFVFEIDPVPRRGEVQNIFPNAHQSRQVIAELIVGKSHHSGRDQIVSPMLHRMSAPQGQTFEPGKGPGHGLHWILQIQPRVTPHVPLLMKVGTATQLSRVGTIGRGPSDKGHDKNDSFGSVRVRVRWCHVPRVLIEESGTAGFKVAMGGRFVQPNGMLLTGFGKLLIGTIVRSQTQFRGAHFLGGILQGHKERIGMTVGSSKFNGIAVGFGILMPVHFSGAVVLRNGGNFRRSGIGIAEQLRHELMQVGIPRHGLHRRGEGLVFGRVVPKGFASATLRDGIFFVW